MRLTSIVLAPLLAISCSSPKGHLEDAVTAAMTPGPANPIAAAEGWPNYQRLVASALGNGDKEALSRALRLSIKTEGDAASQQADVLHGLLHGVGEETFREAVELEIRPVQQAVWSLLRRRGHGS
jgi:hypothetical protein